MSGFGTLIYRCMYRCEVVREKGVAREGSERVTTALTRRFREVSIAGLGRFREGSTAAIGRFQEAVYPSLAVWGRF